jgi:hypothetical protein
MAEVPKIVYQRLRATAAGRGGTDSVHPDADLLTAFAEQALSATERDGVLEHLALCEDCRELVALTLPAHEIAAAPVESGTEIGRTTGLRTETSASHQLFAWPSLRWAALAAGVALAASVLLLRPGKVNQPIPPSVNGQVATTAQRLSPIIQSPMNPPEVSANVAPSHRAESGIAGNKKASAGTLAFDATASHGAAEPGLAEPGLAEPALAEQRTTKDRSSEQVVTETVEVTAAAAAATPAPAEDTLMARNVAPIEKAKPALHGADDQADEADEKQANDKQKSVQPATGTNPAPLLAGRAVMSAAKPAPAASPASAHPIARQIARPDVTLTITEGVLQRSRDSGQSWQEALRTDHRLLCYASHDEDVWAGGQAGTLFHSADGGVTWAQVQPSIKNRQLSADITQIDFRNIDSHNNDLRSDDMRRPAEIVVSTSNNEIWSSSDGGNTWQKK